MGVREIEHTHTYIYIYGYIYLSREREKLEARRKFDMEKIRPAPSFPLTPFEKCCMSDTFGGSRWGV